MHVRVLKCLMCRRGFGTRKEWLSHLLETYHQNKARAQISRWGQSEKECALIAFSSFPIASIELLHVFSNGSMNLVTEFVSFESHPKVGVVQLESKYKVDEILSICGGPEIRINNQLLQVKRAGECLQLEWQALIPFQVDSELQEDPTFEVTEERLPPNAIASTLSLTAVKMESCSSVNSVIHQSGEENGVSQLQLISRGGAEPENDQLVSLVNQYHSICQTIQIPDHELIAAAKLLGTLQSGFSKQFPNCQLIWFRNWFLKLKNTWPLDELHCFLDQNGIYDKEAIKITKNAKKNSKTAVSNNFPPLTKQEIDKLIFTVSDAAHLNIVAREREKGVQRVRERQRKCFSARNYLCQSLGLTFNMALGPSEVIPEIQTCRLLSYICLFDPRVTPLLTVIRFWAKENGIYLAKPELELVGSYPDPMALDWLVIFFLCHKVKILPTPRDIKARKHLPFKFRGANIGFAEDVTFAQEFSSLSLYKKTDEEQHVFNIFSLVTEFFSFYSNELRGKRFVMNTMDAEVIPMEEFVGEIDRIPLQLSRKERKMARKYIKLQNRMTRKQKGEIVKLAPSVILLHPLYLSHGFSFCDKKFISSVCPAMETTGQKLMEALSLYRNGCSFNMKLILKTT